MSEKYYKGIKICCENCCNDGCERGGRCLLKGIVTSQLLWMPSDEAYEARIDELTAFVRKVGASKEMEGHDDGYGGWEFNPWYDEARALLRGKSEEAK